MQWESPSESQKNKRRLSQTVRACAILQKCLWVLRVEVRMKGYKDMRHYSRLSRGDGRVWLRWTGSNNRQRMVENRSCFGELKSQMFGTDLDRQRGNGHALSLIKQSHDRKPSIMGADVAAPVLKDCKRKEGRGLGGQRGQSCSANYSTFSTGSWVSFPGLLQLRSIYGNILPLPIIVQWKHCGEWKSANHPWDKNLYPSCISTFFLSHHNTTFNHIWAEITII